MIVPVPPLSVVETLVVPTVPVEPTPPPMTAKLLTPSDDMTSIASLTEAEEGKLTTGDKPRFRLSRVRDRMDALEEWEERYERRCLSVRREVMSVFVSFAIWVMAVGSAPFKELIAVPVVISSSAVNGGSCLRTPILCAPVENTLRISLSEEEGGKT